MDPLKVRANSCLWAALFEQHDGLFVKFNR